MDGMFTVEQGRVGAVNGGLETDKRSTVGSEHHPETGGTGSLTFETVMTSITPGRKTRMCLDVFAFILCMLVTMIQLAILDYYFLHYLKEHYWYAWIGGDVLVLAAFIGCLIVAIRYNRRCMDQLCTTDANIKYAWVAWLVYSLVLCGKVAVIFRLFYKDINSDNINIFDVRDGSIDVEGIFGRQTFRLALSLTAIVFLLLVESHHYTQLASPRQLYLTYLSTAVTLDILDSILFLDLLWDEKLTPENNPSVPVVMDLTMQIVILTLACFNFFMPTFALLKLRFKKMPRYVPLPYEKLYALIYVLTVNIPYLVIRAYLFRHIQGHDVSIFLVKNLIMIYLAVREVWTRIQYYRMKKASDSTTSAGSQGQLTAEEHHQLNSDKNNI